MQRRRRRSIQDTYCRYIQHCYANESRIEIPCCQSVTYSRRKTWKRSGGRLPSAIVTREHNSKVMQVSSSEIHPGWIFFAAVLAMHLQKVTRGTDDSWSAVAWWLAVACDSFLCCLIFFSSISRSFRYARSIFLILGFFLVRSKLAVALPMESFPPRLFLGDHSSSERRPWKTNRTQFGELARICIVKSASMPIIAVMCMCQRLSITLRLHRRSTD